MLWRCWPYWARSLARLALWRRQAEVNVVSSEILWIQFRVRTLKDAANIVAIFLFGEPLLDFLAGGVERLRVLAFRFVNIEAHWVFGDRAYLVTTGSLTAAAIKWSRGKPIEIWDGRYLANMGVVHAAPTLSDPAPDFAMLAESFGWYSEGPIDDPKEVGPALRRAIAVIRKEGRPALLDTIVRKRELTRFR